MCSPNPSWVFAAKKLIFLFSTDHRSQSHLKFQSCLITEYAGDCFLVKAFSFLDFFLEALPDNMWWCRCCLINVKVFWPRNSTFFLQFSSCDSGGVFGHANSPPHRALGRYRHMSSSRQNHNIFCDWKFLIIALMVEIWIFTALALFLKPLSNLWSSIIFFCTYILCFFSLWWVINLEFGLCFLSYLYFCEAGSHGWIISCS